MADGGFISVVDWSRHQHYKKRKPPWIKVYREVLTDYEITFHLEPWERWCLVGLWLLASETDNRIPADMDWLRARLTIDREPPISKLQTLGFIEVGDSAREMLSKSLSKTETETEKKKNTSESVMEVFEYWREKRATVIGKESGPKMKPTGTRTSKVNARLKEGYTVEDLKRAVDGCLGSQYNVENGYMDLELICRDQQHVEQYLVKAKNGKDKKPDALHRPRVVQGEYQWGSE